VLLRFEKIEERLADLSAGHHVNRREFRQNAAGKASWKFWIAGSHCRSGANTGKGPVMYSFESYGVFTPLRLASGMVKIEQVAEFRDGKRRIFQMMRRQMFLVNAVAWRII
jgi:hypothetical protein